MYIHIGKNKAIFINAIIGTFDIERTTVSIHTKKFLRDAEKKNLVQAASNGIPRSFIVTDTNNKKNVHLSMLATKTIYERGE